MRRRLGLLGGLIAVAAAGVFAAVGIAGTGGSARSVAAAAARAESVNPSARIPAAALMPISRYLGRSDSAYWAARKGSGYAVGRHLGSFRLGFSDAGATFTGAHGQRLTLAAPADASAPIASRNRVSYSAHGLSEWFAYGPAGLEQGFDVSAPRPGATSAPRPGSSGGTLTLPVGVSGTLRPVLRDGSVDFLDRAGKTVLRYGGVSVTDASGRALKSSLEVTAGAIHIAVDTRGARYPLLVDPTIVASNALLEDASPQGDSALGVSVAISGSTIVVGEDQGGADCGAGNGGAVDIFTEPSGGWSGTLSSPVVLQNPQDGDTDNCQEEDAYDFGEAVAVAVAAGHQWIVVGDDGDGPGAAYVYEEPSGGWSAWTHPYAYTQSLSTDDLPSVDAFGGAVAIDDNTIAVGSRLDRDQDGDLEAGVVDLYTYSDSGWQQVASLSESTDGLEDDAEIGQSVALADTSAGTVVVAGAPYWYDTELGKSGEETGAALVWLEPGGGWLPPDENSTPSFRLVNPWYASASPDAEDGFGTSVAIDPTGSLIAVGSPAYSSSQASSGQAVGAVAVYAIPDGGWQSDEDAATSPDAQLFAAVPGDEASLGYGVAVAGGTVWATEPYYEGSGGPGSGAVLEYPAPSGGWAAEDGASLTESDDLIAAGSSASSDPSDATAAGNSDAIAVDPGSDTVVAGATGINETPTESIGDVAGGERDAVAVNYQNEPAGGAFVWSAATPQSTGTTTTTTTTTSATFAPTAKGTVETSTVTPAQTPVCAKPTGSIHGLVVGPVRLGMAAAAVSRVFLRHNQTYYGTERFCVIGGDERVEYPTHKLLGQLAASMRTGLEHRVVLELTANPYYVLDGVRHGTSAAEAVKRLHLGAGITIGLNTWYLADAGVDDLLVKTVHGRVREIGYLDSHLLGGLQSHLSGPGSRLEQFFATFLNSGIHL